MLKARTEQAHPGLKVELVPMVTRGDVILDTPLARWGQRLVKELELAMHSMKDVPVEFPEGLVTICERDDPRDAFVSNRYASIDELPAGSVVAHRQVYAVSASWPPPSDTDLSAR